MGAEQKMMLALLQSPDLQAVTHDTVQLIMPEVILTLFACAALVLDVMLPRNSKRVVAWVSLVGVGAALVSLFIMYAGMAATSAPHIGFFKMIVVDNYAVVFKAMFLIGAPLSILLPIKNLAEED